MSQFTQADMLTAAAQTAGVIVAGLVGLWLIRQGMCLVLKLVPGLNKADREAQAGKALGLTTVALSFVVVVAAALWVSQIWGIDIAGWSATPLGRKLTGTGISLIVVVVGAAIALEATSLALHFSLARLKRRTDRDVRRAAQLNTLGPIASSAVQITIVVLAAMTVLSQVGVQIAPILAGAGVVGIAIGFGAQTLVKDIFTGFFLIIEDIVAVGDIVQIQAFGGEVEKMSLRTIRLRDFDGTLHIFPYGEAQIIHNMTKNFSYAAVDLPVKVDTDIDHALTVMRTTAETLRKDAEFGPMILGDIEIAGVDMLSDIGIILKARIRTQPLERWRVLREYNRRIKQAFDAEEIVLTHK